MPRRGENIFKRKDGRWEARYIHHYENGKAVYRYLYGTTYMEVKAKRLAEQSSPDYIHVPEVKRLATFEELAGMWLADVKITVKESTYTRYYRIVQIYLFPFLRKQLLLKIDSGFLKGLTERLLAEGGARKESLSPKTVSDILCVLKAILQYGRNQDYPCPDPNLLRYPQKKSKKIKILTEKNRIRFL